MKSRPMVLAFFGLALWVVVLSACTHRPYDGKLNLETPPPTSGAEEIAVFKYDHAPVNISLKFEEDTDKFAIYLVKFDVKDFPELKNRYARAYYFVQKKKNVKAPCMIVLPPTGGGMELTKDFATFYAENGFTTLSFYRREMFFNPDQDMEYNTRLIQQSVIDVQRGLDFLQTQPEVDIDKVGLMGVSLGGIIGALATEADGRIKASSFLISSGNLPKILETSGYSRVRKFRSGMMERYHKKTVEELIEFLRPQLAPVDPITYAKRLDPARVLMINGNMDNIIALEAARDTWEAFGHPEWRTLPCGHYSAFLLVKYAKKVTMEHFKKVLNLS